MMKGCRTPSNACDLSHRLYIIMTLSSYALEGLNSQTLGHNHVIRKIAVACTSITSTFFSLSQLLPLYDHRNTHAHSK